MGLRYFLNKHIEFSTHYSEFCATPTTAAVERIFSTAGFVISSRRTFLSDEMFEFLLLDHLNSDLRTFAAIVDEIVNGRKRKFEDIS